MIIRNPDRNRYAVIDNRVLEDSRLSWKARGLLAYLLTKPDGWHVVASHLVTQSPDGRFAVDGCLRELEACGYITRGSEQLRTAGRFDAADVEVHECPVGGWPFAETSNGDRSRKTVNGKTVNGKTRTSKDSCKQRLNEVNTHSLAPTAVDAVDKFSIRTAILEACGGQVLSDLARGEKAKLNTAAKDIADAGGSPEAVHARAANWPRRFTVPISPKGLANNWSALETTDANVSVVSDAERFGITLGRSSTSVADADAEIADYFDDGDVRSEALAAFHRARQEQLGSV